MSSYSFFARFYDVLTEDVNYKVRSDYISDFLLAENIKNGTLIDLACGTGSFSVEFAKKGFDVIGVDMSSEMLMIAKSKLDSANLICSKMQDFVLENSADSIISCLDSINHLTDINDVQKAFDNAYASLKDNGVFVFDVNTIYKHNEVLANNTFIFDEDNYYIVWDNELVDDREVRILLDFFIYNGDSYDRYSEEFNERAYSIEELQDMLKSSGFHDIKVYDELTTDAPKNDSERLYFVCKK